MTDATNEAPRTEATVIATLKTAVGKLARQEAKAVDSDTSAATFNQDIMDMATGKVAQTPERSIASVAAEQAKHVKRAAKIRANNTELAGEIAALRDEFNEMVDALLTPYETEEAPETAEDEAPEVEEEEAETEAE